MAIPQQRPTDESRAEAVRRIGILGGGQLGLFLCRAARDLGLHSTVLTPDGDSPAAGAADRVLVGSLGDVEAAARLVAETELISFEVENIAVPVLRYLVEAEHRGLVRVRPDPRVLLTLQNKALQKDWLMRNGLPTPPFRVLSASGGDPRAVAERFGLPFVQKTQRGGYDGRGVQIIRDESELSRWWSVPCLVEPYLGSAREVAVVVARGVDGSMRSYAPVDLHVEPERNVLESVTSPAALSSELAAAAIALAERSIHRLAGVGVFAVEMFLSGDGELLINEISPRVHNSGHHTLDACQTSQFEQHLRAITGLPLGPVGTQRAAVMRNLLHRPGLTACPEDRSDAGTAARLGDDVFLYWYGKRQARPWRKMGHLTCLAPDPCLAAARAEAAWRQLNGGTDEAAA